MNTAALAILRKLSVKCDVSLKEALSFSPKNHGDFRDQYPLAMLIEAEYIGVTLNHSVPSGAEKMREYAVATMLHSLRVQKNPDGSIPPAVVFLDASKEHVFLKAKGALYLDEVSKKRWDRFYSFLVGVLVAVCGLAAKSWLEKKFNESPATPPAATAPADQKPRRP